MDQLKQNLFWIILVVILAAGIGVWVTYMPPVEEVKNNAKNNAQKVKQLADSKKSQILSPAYVRAVETYGKELDAQKAALYKKWEGAKIDVKFTDVPGTNQPTIEFDNYIGRLRDKMAEKMTAANVKVPETWPAMTFAGSGTDDRSQELTRHRDYRLRYMAVLEDIIDAICAKPGSITQASFETDPVKPEPAKADPAGPIALLKFTFHTPEETAKIDLGNYEKAMQIAGRKPVAGSAQQQNVFKGPEAPLDVSSIDVEFLSPISAVPGVLRKLESSSRYFGLITKTDFERAAPLFPPTKEVKDAKDLLYKAGFIPTMNTHYGEGPVRVLVTMALLEYSKKKAEEFDKAPAPPKPPANPPKK